MIWYMKRFIIPDEDAIPTGKEAYINGGGSFDNTIYEISKMYKLPVGVVLYIGNLNKQVSYVYRHYISLHT